MHAGFAQKVLKSHLAVPAEELFSRKGAKTQRNPLETRQRLCAFAPLRETSLRMRFLCKAMHALASVYWRSSSPAFAIDRLPRQSCTCVSGERQAFAST